jgi:hypothetical protein
MKSEIAIFDLATGNDPTTAPADDLATARAMGRTVVVSPGQSVNWWTKVTAGRGLRAAAPGVGAADGEF